VSGGGPITATNVLGSIAMPVLFMAFLDWQLSLVVSVSSLLVGVMSRAGEDR